MSFLGSLVGGTFSLVSGVGNSMLNGWMNDYWTRRDEARQHDYAVMDWNMQNAYNTPAMQMARYADAGLNPNLIYGQSNMAGSVGSGPGGHSYNLKSDPLMMLEKVYGIENMKEQNKNIAQQNKNLASQQSLNEIQRSFVEAQKERYEYETEWLKRNNTTSFEQPLIRSVAAHGRKLMYPLAEGLGTIVGHLSGGGVNNVVVNPNAFKSNEEMWQVLRPYIDNGYNISFNLGN